MMEGKWKCVGFEFLTDEEEREDLGAHAFKAIIRRENASTKVGIADAYLISAAPELLAALEDLKIRYHGAVMWMLDRESDSTKWPDWMPGCRTAVEEADAAIAKAKGEV